MRYRVFVLTDLISDDIFYCCSVKCAEEYSVDKEMVEGDYSATQEIVKYDGNVCSYCGKDLERYTWLDTVFNYLGKAGRMYYERC